MKELVVLAAAVLIAYLLTTAFPAITDLSLEEMQIERRINAFIGLQESDRISKEQHEIEFQSLLSCN